MDTKNPNGLRHYLGRKDLEYLYEIVTCGKWNNILPSPRKAAMLQKKLLYMIHYVNKHKGMEGTVFDDDLKGIESDSKI